MLRASDQVDSWRRAAWIEPYRNKPGCMRHGPPFHRTVPKGVGTRVATGADPLRDRRNRNLQESTRRQCNRTRTTDFSKSDGKTTRRLVHTRRRADLHRSRSTDTGNDPVVVRIKAPQFTVPLWPFTGSRYRESPVSSQEDHSESIDTYRESPAAEKGMGCHLTKSDMDMSQHRRHRRR